jgi:hypothetical protein
MGRRCVWSCEPGYRPESKSTGDAAGGALKDLCATTGETTSYPTNLAKYTNQVVGYTLVDAALKNCSKSSCTKMYIPVAHYFLPCLNCARYVVKRSLKLLHSPHVLIINIPTGTLGIYSGNKS